MQLSSQATDGQFGLHQFLGADRAQAHDVFGAKDGKLLFVERSTVGDFFGFGVSVSRRPAFDGVQNVGVTAVELAGLDHLGQQLARLADEGPALAIFVGPGGFPKEHESRRDVAFAEHGFRPTARKDVAFGAGRNFGGPCFQLSLTFGRWQRRSRVGAVGRRKSGDRIDSAGCRNGSPLWRFFVCDRRGRGR
ncbi:hypothetical protein Poly51_10550 [Rubripirellula tenax]|uniref:Uncharacterized protein n=1 Tax=Rubripirellula tenax TaxID=2528015 RepID=A0A5C6FLS6_9BACT|nr:hypothetical protein Poly51_10550 [Rubripirellula tenax]